MLQITTELQVSKYCNSIIGQSIDKNKLNNSDVVVTSIFQVRPLSNDAILIANILIPGLLLRSYLMMIVLYLIGET